ncbi:MAG TPA: hypothetical protein VNB22_24945, partial [Pyrinomonadaceae bacterium]|nr:hypothetical protein [Pyrinomonadaceae bacterium]
MSSDKKLCPSHTCEKGAILLGIVMRDGRVAFSSDRIIVNEEFVQIARAGRAPEKRFRFGGQCVQSGCGQWTGKRCGVIDSITETADIDVESAELPECSIRPECRWFFQSGA